MPPDWRIYYADGSTFSSDDGAPESAPPEGFVCAVGYDEGVKRYIMHGWDFYQWDKEHAQWWGMDQTGLHDRLRRNLVYAYKEGRTVTKAEFNELMHRAHKDPDFPL
ncbi:MAG: hypothetical protein OEM91_16160 [Hyphomicrobiales bacterium]|nr:hypothetical protein [Hyphomicrobiales bacterium]